MLTGGEAGALGLHEGVLLEVKVLIVREPRTDRAGETLILRWVGAMKDPLIVTRTGRQCGDFSEHF